MKRSPFEAAILARAAGPDADVVLATARDPAHAAGGRIAHANGDALEHWLERQHRRAVERGLLARMRHVGPPTEPHVEGGRVRKDRRGRLVVVVAGVGPADYQGQLPGGRSVALEAKSREGRLYRDEVPEHQAADLDACAAGGGLAVLVARLDGVVHAIPWREVPWCSPRGGKPSIGAGDVTAWAVDARCLLDPRDARWRFYLEPLAGGRDA